VLYLFSDILKKYDMISKRYEQEKVMFFKIINGLHSQKEQEVKTVTIDQAIEALKNTPFQDSFYAYEVLSDIFERKKNGEKVDFNKVPTRISFGPYKIMPYLDLAIRYFPPAAFQYLIENGAQLKKDMIHDIVCYQRYFNAKSDEAENIIQFVKKHGADLNALDKDSHSILYNINSELKMRNDEVALNFKNALVKYGATLLGHEVTSEKKMTL
jgi:hypothetical protein